MLSFGFRYWSSRGRCKTRAHVNSDRIQAGPVRLAFIQSFNKLGSLKQKGHCLWSLTWQGNGLHAQVTTVVLLMAARQSPLWKKIFIIFELTLLDLSIKGATHVGFHIRHATQDRQRRNFRVSRGLSRGRCRVWIFAILHACVLRDASCKKIYPQSLGVENKVPASQKANSW